MSLIGICGDDCSGCSCHINPPCHHCTEHLVEDMDELLELENKVVMAESKVKQYCYQNDCEIVLTGLNTNYPVCRKCRQEVSDNIYQDYLNKQKRKK